MHHILSIHADWLAWNDPEVNDPEFKRLRGYDVSCYHGYAYRYIDCLGFLVDTVIAWAALFIVDGIRHQQCGSLSQGMMPGPAAAMQSFNAAAAAAAGSHHHGQMPSQYHVTLPAHQPPIRHSHSMVDSAYASVPGIRDIFLFLFIMLYLFLRHFNSCF